MPAAIDDEIRTLEPRTTLGPGRGPDPARWRTLVVWPLE
jgi:hypothetical protein